MRFLKWHKSKDDYQDKLVSESPKSEFSLYFTVNNRNLSLSKLETKIFHEEVKY